MDKTKKKRIKKYVSWVCIVTFVGLLTLMPLLAGSGQVLTGPQASILSGTVTTGSITTALSGGGTLASQKAVEVKLPQGVKISEFLVSNGDTVREGDPLAVIDRVSVMSAIAEVQETMDYLREEMAGLSNGQTTTRLTAKAGGSVKQVFACPGDDVQDVMLRHGALAVLSLDGLLAVQIPLHPALAIGDRVSILLPDVPPVFGRVSSNADGILTVTLEDDGYAVGTEVSVTDSEGNFLGSGPLTVHNAWNVVAYSGTVESVNIQPGDQTYSGQTLLTVQETGISTRQEALVKQHRDYEALMLKLFSLYQSDVLTAPCDGIVKGVDENSIHLLSGSSVGAEYAFLANAPGSDPDAMYDNHVGQLEGILGSSWIVRMNPDVQQVTDYQEALTTVDTDPEKMTHPAMMDPVTVYRLVEGEWIISEAQKGDILLFALGEDGFVWAVYLSGEEPEVPETTEPSDPDTETDPTEEPTDPEAPSDPEPPSEPEESPEDPPENGFPTFGDGFGQFFGGFPGMPQEEEYQLYSLEESLLLQVIPQEEMTLSIQLDERDIRSVYVGMHAEITVPALHNAVLPAVVTKVGDVGIYLGGSSKFTVELTLQPQKDMLAGMSATVSIPLFTTESVPLIPVEALAETETGTFVYTAFDESTGELIQPVAVTLGSSDGIYAEIRSGLSAGDVFWYSYYDTLEIDHGVEEPMFGFG